MLNFEFRRLCTEHGRKQIFFHLRCAPLRHGFAGQPEEQAFGQRIWQRGCGLRRAGFGFYGCHGIGFAVLKMVGKVGTQGVSEFAKRAADMGLDTAQG